MLDLMDDAVIQCPFPVYDDMRENHPVYYYERGGFYIITRAEDIRTALANPTLFSNDTLDKMGFTSKLRSVLIPEKALIVADPPQHTRTRGTVDRAFTAARVNAMEDKIQAITDALFENFIEKGEFEVVAELSKPLPVIVIAGELGVPGEDHLQFRRWSDAITATFNPGQTPQETESYSGDIAALNLYMLARRAEKIARPANDIISVLAQITPQSTDGGPETTQPLTDAEFLSITQMILVAGNETTSAALTSVLHRLATDADLFARLKSDRSLIRAFIEEILRLESPVQGFYRIVTEDTELSGVKLAKGSRIYVRYGAGNRDPRVFAQADQLDLSRTNRSQHLAFGGGIHHCLGQMLARKELACVTNTLCDRFRAMALMPDQVLRYINLFQRRGLTSLKLSFTREA